MTNFESRITRLENQLSMLKDEYEQSTQFTNHILKKAEEYGTKALGINKTSELVQTNPWLNAPSSLFAKERDEYDNLQVWRLARDFFPGACGNTEQYQIPVDATVVDGIYEFKDGKWTRHD